MGAFLAGAGLGIGSWLLLGSGRAWAQDSGDRSGTDDTPSQWSSDWEPRSPDTTDRTDRYGSSDDRTSRRSRRDRNGTADSSPYTSSRDRTDRSGPGDGTGDDVGDGHDDPADEDATDASPTVAPPSPAAPTADHRAEQIGPTRFVVADVPQEPTPRRIASVAPSAPVAGHGPVALAAELMPATPISPAPPRSPAVDQLSPTLPDAPLPPVPSALDARSSTELAFLNLLGGFAVTGAPPARPPPPQDNGPPLVGVLIPTASIHGGRYTIRLDDDVGGLACRFDAVDHVPG